MNITLNRSLVNTKMSRSDKRETKRAEQIKTKKKNKKINNL